jgi:hypothetical protein
MKKLLSLLLVLVSMGVCLAQENWPTSISIDFPKLSQLSLDNQGFLFIADTEGNIYQYDRKGLEINNFSPHRQAAISVLEAAWTVNIFSFSQDLQEYRILDRFINPVSENRIPMQHFNLVKIATLGNNNVIWAFDETDLSLKQWDYRRNRILQNQPLNLVLERSSLGISDMREYQNLLFLNIEEEGIYVLDNQGNFIKRIPQEIRQKLAFWKNNLVFIENNQLILLDYLSGSKTSFELAGRFKDYHVRINQYQVILYNDREILLFTKNQTPLKDL